MKYTGLVLASMLGILASNGFAADAPYAKQAWPQGRVLVWSQPGTNGYTLRRPRIPGSSVMAWRNELWTEYDSEADHLSGRNGRENTQPPDENTDLILPDAPDGKPYVVSYAVMPRKRLDGLYAPQWRRPSRIPRRGGTR